jgi:hypothetical protein
VRVVPRPAADSVRFTVEVDPGDNWPETDEGNNRFDSSSYHVVTTRSMCFYVTPVQSGGDSPRVDNLNIKEQVEFLLAIYPFADNKVTWRMAPATTQSCADDPAHDCLWAITDEGDFRGTAATMALGVGCDYGVAIGPWSGGGSTCRGCTGGAVLGQGGGFAVLAHEFNHSMTAVADLYSLDCMVDWDEVYCEFSDGSRKYYCQDDTNKPEGYTSQNCRCADGDMGNVSCSTAEMVCEIETKVCEMNTGCSPYRRDHWPACEEPAETCDLACAYAIAEADCTGEIGVDHGPDCRILHPTSEGFWVNRWEPQPEGQAYIMDCSAPSYWMVMENSVDHCGEQTVYQDGYRNMLLNPNFVTGEDPEALLVHGVIHRSGEVDLKPFIYLPQSNLDRASGADGAYRFVLYDAQGSILSQTGFDVYFASTGANPGTTESTSFAMRIEWVSGTQRVVLYDPAGQEVSITEVTRNTPEVRVTTPKGGETLLAGREQTVRWEASDADGDALTYFVDISPDKGETWLALAIDLEQDTYHFDTGMFEPGDGYLIRVRASDGINTGEDLSDAPFTISAEAGPPSRSLILVGLILLGLIGVGSLATALILFIRRRA